MSSDAFEKFRAAIAADAALQAQCLAALQAGDVQQVLDLARAQGCAFTAEEATAALDQAELTDLELEVVAGGYPAKPSIDKYASKTRLER